MEPLTRFSLRTLPPWHPGRAVGAAELISGSEVRRIVAGDELAFQARLGNAYLVVVDYDCFDYTDHWFYLLDEDDRVLDQVSTPSYLGFIEKIVYESSDSISFGFFGTNDRWTLSVSERPFWSFIPAHLLARPNRFVLARRRLVPRCKRGEPWSFHPGEASRSYPALERIARPLAWCLLMLAALWAIVR